MARMRDPHRDAPPVTAVLGPTNTGKTHYAIERMLGRRTGVIGLPLRLLAREVYDRIVAVRGPSVVALVTGEERIEPPRAQYWVCTVEAMPLDLSPDFVAVDEIQLCADPERGHIFTDRLLYARGTQETLLLGSATMRARIAALVPNVRFEARERFSTLSWAGTKKISRMPARAAVVGFSIDQIYAIAELLRRQKGGAAVVMGALSPRTRNAQVELFQNGDVDHIVATDAIGMGLNLDIGHVAFASLTKFDGHRHRELAAPEIGQIAGRAGRHMKDGTFGVTGEAGVPPQEVIEAVESHAFPAVERLSWRNSRLEFGTAAALIASLEAPSGRADLARAREADDLATLRTLAAVPEIVDRLAGGRDVRLLWEVCQFPDFRKVGPGEHVALARQIFEFLHGPGRIPEDWLARRVQLIDRTEGDIDALSKRLAFIRTWTYLAQRRDWVESADHWRGETRAVEDRLSDALHGALTQRFVDRRTSVLMRRLKQKESLVAEVNDKGAVEVEGQFIGRIEGFRFRLDQDAGPEETRTLRAAAAAALAPALQRRADKLYNAPDSEFDVTEQGGLMWGTEAVGKLVKGADILSPVIDVFVDEEAGADVAEKVRRRLSHWLERRIAQHFEPLMALKNDESITGLARGVAYRLVESLGVIPRSEIAGDVKALEQEARSLLRKQGVRFGQFTLFQPLMLKPAPTRLRLILWALHEGLDQFPEAPPPGLVTIPAQADAPRGYYQRAGYRLSGERAIRIDMLERLADLIRVNDVRSGFEATPDMLSITGLSLDQFASLMKAMGYRAERGERPKQKPAEAAAAADATAAATGASAPVADGGAEAAPAEEAGDASPDGGDAPEGGAASDEHAAAVGEAAATDALPQGGVDEAAGSPAGPVDAAEMPAAPAEPAEAAASGDPAETAPAEAVAGQPAVAEPAADAPEIPAEAAVEATAEETVGDATPQETASAPEQAASDAAPEDAEAATTGESAGDATADDAAIEVFYTFTLAPRPQRSRQRRGQGSAAAPDAPAQRREGEAEGGREGGRDRDGQKRGGKGRREAQKGGRRPGQGGQQNRGGKHDKPRDTSPRSFTAGPARSQGKADPDSPFAALLALKDKL